MKVKLTVSLIDGGGRWSKDHNTFINKSSISKRRTGATICKKVAKNKKLGDRVVRGKMMNGGFSSVHPHDEKASNCGKVEGECVGNCFLFCVLKKALNGSSNFFI